MNAQSVTNFQREDVLRELNLYPLWRLRVSGTAENHGTAEKPGAPKDASVEKSGAEYVQAPVFAELKAETAADIKAVAVDFSQLGWSELNKQVTACTACNLHAGRMQTVFGMGDESADWLFVGSWPSEDDEAKGQPFAGQAGQLLDNMLAAIKLKRDENVYLANIVKCSGAIQRAPQAEEIAQCAAYLAQQIQLLQPKMIVALGHAAATALLGEDREWSGLLGKLHHYIAEAKEGSQTTIPLIITHHPAALLLAPLNKAQAWRDLCLARDSMRRLLSGESHASGD